MTAFIAGAPPLKGTCTALSLACTLRKYSAAICEPLPTPAVPKLMLLPWADLMKSARFAAGLDSDVARHSGLDATTATGFKSVAAKPLFGVSVSLIASAVV